MLALAALTAAIALLWLSFAGLQTHANDGKATLVSCSAGSRSQPGGVNAIANAINVSANELGSGAASMYVEFTVTGGNGYSAFGVSPSGDVKISVTASFGVIGIHIPDYGSYTLTCEVFTTVDGLPSLADTSTYTFTVGSRDATPTPTPMATPTPTRTPDPLATVDSCNYSGDTSQPGYFDFTATAANQRAVNSGANSAFLRMWFMVQGPSGLSLLSIDYASVATPVGSTESFSVETHIPETGSFTLTCQVRAEVNGLVRVGESQRVSFTIDGQTPTLTPVDDHGNTRASATAILLNSDAPGSIEKAGDQDYFSFYADKDATYTISVTPESGFDAQLWLYGPDGTQLAHNNNASTPGAAIRGFKATRGGSHYVRVTAAGSSATGTYVLSINVDAPPPGVDRHGNTRDKATTISPNSPVTGKINVAGDVDYFVFSGQHGADYLIGVASDDNMDTELALFDASGNQLAYNDDSPAQGVTSLINYRASQNGDLYVRVSEFGDNGTGSYTLTLSEPRAHAGDDHGNEIAASTTMSANSSEPGNIETAGDVDYFAFHADAGVSYTIDTFGSGVANTELTLYDKDGAQLAHENDQTRRGASITHRAAQAGALHLRVAGTGAIKTGTYTLSVNADTTPVQDDHSNTRDKATQIALNSSQTGKIEIAGDVDYFVFAATGGTDYTISASSASGLDTVLTLFDAAGAQLGSDDDGGIGFGSLIAYTQPGTQVANLYIRVSESGGDAIGGYTLSLAAGAPPPVGDDHGNEIPAATTMSVNSSEGGNIEVLGDQDYFAFQADAGVSYTIGAASTAVLDTELWLYASDGTRLAHDDNSGSGNASRIKHRAARAGTLYVQVAEAGNDATGTYTLSVNADSEPLTDDHGNTRAKATTVPVNSDTAGNIEVAGDVDYFAFQAAQGATYTIDAASTDGTDTELWLYDANGVQLAYDDDSGDRSAAARIKFKAKQVGKLYARVAEYRNDGTGSYTLSVTVLDAKADLETTAVSVLPASPTIGQKITVNYTLRNNGAGLASNFFVTLLIDDAVVSTQSGLSIVGDGSFNGSFSSIWTCAAGRHVILVSSDRNNQIDESKENNNESTASVNCRPANSS